MNIDALMAGLTLPPGLVGSPIHQLIARKLSAEEDATMPRLPIFDAFVVDALSIPVPLAPTTPRGETSAQATLLAGLLLDRIGKTRVPKEGSRCS